MSPSRSPKPRRLKPSHARRKHAPTPDAAPAPAASPPIADPPPDPVRTDARALLGSLMQLVARAAIDPSKGRELIALADTLDLPPMPEQSAAAAPFGAEVGPVSSFADPADLAFARWLASTTDEVPAADVLTLACQAAGELSPLTPEQLPGWITRARHAMTAADDWATLGATLGALGPHRLPIAMRAARAVAGGPGMPVEEEDAIAAWFSGRVAGAIEATGGATAEDRGEHNPVADALWYLFVGDQIHDHAQLGRPRCLAIDACPRPGERGFVAAVASAAAGYIHTVIAGASPGDLADLRALFDPSDDDLEDYRPFAFTFVEDQPATKLMERALRDLTLRRPTNAQLCSGFENWACAFRQLASEHSIPPVHRIGAAVWLARTLRRDEERGA